MRGLQAAWHSRWRVPTKRTIYRRFGGNPRAAGTLARECQQRSRLILGAAEPLHGLGHARGVVDDLREAHDGHDVVRRDGSPVDLFEEVDELLVTARSEE